jgi:hypothetical protein
VSAARRLWGCGEKDKLAARHNASLGYRQGGVHVVDRAERDDMESAIGGHGFDTIRPDLGGEIEGANNLPQKTCLFVLGFGKGDLDLRAEKRDGNSREASSGSEVEQSGGLGIEMARGKEAFAEVPADDLFGVADRSQVRAGVPFEKEIEIEGELGEESGWGVQEVWCEEFRDFGF